MSNSEIEALVRSSTMMLAAHVVDSLVEGELEQMFSPFQTNRSDIAAQIVAVLNEYDQSVVPIPGQWWKDLEIDIDDQESQWVARTSVRLWTERQAPSDLVVDLKSTRDVQTMEIEDEVLGIRVDPYRGERRVPPRLEPRVWHRNDAPPEPDSDPVPVRWRPVLSALVHRLVVGDFDALVAEGLAPDVPAGFPHGVIGHYGATLVDLPDEAWAYSTHEAFGDGGEAIVTLWTAEEGPSKLSMVATVDDDGRSPPTAVIDVVEIM